MRAIFVKELRENIKWLPVGVLLVGIFACLSTPTELRGCYGNIAMSLASTIGLGASLCAVALGAAQSVLDFGQTQRGYLFHRAVARDQVLYGKVAAGAVLYAIACGVPLLLVALWFQLRGLEYLPVRPALVVPALLTCLACWPLHPATIICLDRNAAWLGTKLFPLIAVGAFAFVLFLGLATGSATANWLTIIVGLPLAASVLLAIPQHHWARSGLLVLGSVCTLMLVVGMLNYAVSTLAQSTRPRQHSVGSGLDAEGNLWIYRYRSELNESGTEYTSVPISGDQMRPHQMPNLLAKLPEDFKPTELQYVLSHRHDQEIFARFQYKTTLRQTMLFFDSRGYLLAYDGDQLAEPPLKGTISRSGFHPLSEPPGSSFKVGLLTLDMVGLRFGNSGLLSDRDGVYQYTPASGEVATLLDMPIESQTPLMFGKEQTPELFIESRDGLHVFALTDPAGSTDWFDQDRTTGIVRTAPPLRLQPVASLPKLPSSFNHWYSIGRSASGRYVALTFNGMMATLASGDATAWEVSQVPLPPQNQNWESLVFALMPPVLYLFGLLVFFGDRLLSGATILPPIAAGWTFDWQAQLYIFSVVLTLLVALGLVEIAGRRRGLNRSQLWSWLAATFALGLAAPLAMLAIYPVVVRQACPRCDKARRLDRSKCEHCGTAWDAPMPEGIELLENANRPSESLSARYALDP